MAKQVTKCTMGVQDDGSKAVILAEVELTSYRMENHNGSRNDEAMHLQLDLVDEARATAE